MERSIAWVVNSAGPLIFPTGRSTDQMRVGSSTLYGIENFAGTMVSLATIAFCSMPFPLHVCSLIGVQITQESIQLIC